MSQPQTYTHLLLHAAPLFHCANGTASHQMRTYDERQNFRLQTAARPGSLSDVVVVANAGLSPQHGDLVVIVHDDGVFDVVRFRDCRGTCRCSLFEASTSDRRKVHGVVIRTELSGFAMRPDS